MRIYISPGGTLLLDTYTRAVNTLRCQAGAKRGLQGNKCSAACGTTLLAIVVDEDHALSSDAADIGRQNTERIDDVLMSLFIRNPASSIQHRFDWSI